MGETPTASVLLPVYNAERYLAEAIESVLNQTFRDFELLLLNDGSTDGSPRTPGFLCRPGPPMPSPFWPNRGLIATLNAGLEIARAEYIFRMDADDICLPDRFAKQIQFLKDHPDCVVAGSRVALIDPEGLHLGEYGHCFEHDEIDAANLTGVGSFITHPAAVIRKTALALTGGYRDAYRHAEDLDLFLRLAEVGRIANLHDVLLKYRQHVESIGHRHPEHQRASSQQAVVAACERRGLDVHKMKERFVSSSPPLTPGDTHRKWGWWALREGHVATARKHALRALSYKPFSLENWRLAACVLRGY